eukprot:1528693-Pleurochrysis_carterae.AAC.1
MAIWHGETRRRAQRKARARVHYARRVGGTAALQQHRHTHAEAKLLLLLLPSQRLGSWGPPGEWQRREARSGNKASAKERN